MFLTSANLSNKPEIYTSREINDEFKYYIDNNKIKFIWENTWKLPENGTSDIFEFIWESLDLKYLRKN